MSIPLISLLLVRSPHPLLYHSWSQDRSLRTDINALRMPRISLGFANGMAAAVVVEEASWCS